MKKTKVIPHKYIPNKLPINATALQVFFLHYFEAPSWLWGSYITVAVLIWIVILIGINNQKADESLLNNERN